MVAVNGVANLKLADIRQEVERLRHVRQQLSQQLLDAADQLESPGLPPATVLIDELLTCRRRTQRLAEVLGARTGFGDDGVSLDQLEHLIEVRDCRHLAETVLKELLELTHADIPDFAPLTLCRNEASRLCELAAESNGAGPLAELEMLRQGRHPLNALVRLCNEGDRLSDVEWTSCHDEVAATYGRQLATALSRGHIQHCGDAASSPIAAEPIQIVGGEQRLRSKDANSILEPLSETIFDLAPVNFGLEARLKKELSTDADLPTVPSSRTDVRPTALNLSRSNVANVCQSPVEHIIRLMTEDRLPLALQLVRCVEQRKESLDGIPPSWLLQGLILGRHLNYSKGEIARQLEEEFQNFQSELLTEGSDERRQAMSFLLRAAALPAALLAGSASAMAILRSFKITPGCSQLYNYCSRIAIYGDRLSGRLVEMFHPAGTISGASELDELSQTAKDWLQQAAKNAVTYKRNSPLFLHAHWTLTAGTAIQHSEEAFIWCKWQEALSLAYRLLQPICDRADGERNWVRQEIARLTSQVRVDQGLRGSRGGSQLASQTSGIVLPSEMMHTVMLEAVAIANRWLRLCQQTAAGGSPLPLEALDLRDEIMQRSESVLAELTQQRQLALSPFVQAAIACCQRTIRQIHAMFESRLTLPLEEPDPRHLLSAELLRIPGIELNDHWQPETDLDVVERELIASLEHKELTWRQSYDHHVQLGNHEATGRLLELDVWPGAQERDSLAALRQTQIAECRAAVDAELQELAGDIDAMTNGDRSTLERRLQRLQHELPRVVNFAIFRRQLLQLQSAVLRHRASLSPSMTPTVSRNSSEPTESGRQGGWHDRVVRSYDIFSGE